MDRQPPTEPGRSFIGVQGVTRRSDRNWRTSVAPLSIRAEINPWLYLVSFSMEDWGVGRMEPDFFVTWGPKHLSESTMLAWTRKKGCLRRSWASRREAGGFIIRDGQKMADPMTRMRLEDVIGTRHCESDTQDSTKSQFWYFSSFGHVSQQCMCGTAPTKIIGAAMCCARQAEYQIE